MAQAGLLSLSQCLGLRKVSCSTGTQAAFWSSAPACFPALQPEPQPPPQGLPWAVQVRQVRQPTYSAARPINGITISICPFMFVT